MKLGAGMVDLLEIGEINFKDVYSRFNVFEHITLFIMCICTQKPLRIDFERPFFEEVRLFFINFRFQGDFGCN